MRKPRNERSDHHAGTRPALAVMVLAWVLSACAPRGAAKASEATLGPLATSAVTLTEAPAQPAQHSTPPAYFSSLVDRARALAAAPPRRPEKAALPAELRDIRYDAYRSIRFRPERSLWRQHDRVFEAQFFHPGYYYQDTVSLFELGSDGPRALQFAPELFSYGDLPAPPSSSTLGFTGFRLHAPINRADYRDEVIVFQGASYFRVLGQGTVYGLSARGLAVDLGEPKTEEFPRFSEFYLTEPAPGQVRVWVLALLESERATGAYAFLIEPGGVSVVDVEARVFLRDTRLTIGLAPLTSMYLFGEEGPNRFRDFRPEVHDSDGLSMLLESGEWLLRPLRNPKKTSVCSFRANHSRGFGLVQRDRQFDSYQDLEARYQDRPSVWVEPLLGFERGSLRLLEIASELETDDNIALAFVPDELVSDEMSLRYRLHVGQNVPDEPRAARVSGTRLARTQRGTRFLIDFVGSAGNVPPGTSGPARADQPAVELSLTAQGVSVLEAHVEAHPFIEGHRASFELEGPKQKAPNPVELRAFLRRGPDTISETWSYLWQPEM